MEVLTIILGILIGVIIILGVILGITISYFNRVFRELEDLRYLDEDDE